jgi:hypothetical protein
VSEETAVGRHAITLEATLPAPAAFDGDYHRARTPRTPPARNYVSAWADPERELYEYHEVVRDPASPLAAARLLARQLVRRDSDFAERLAQGLGDRRTAPRSSEVRRAFREILAQPFADEVAALTRRPVYGPRERRDLEAIVERLDERGRALAARVAALTTAADDDDLSDATEAALESLGKELLEDVDAAGLPLAFAGRPGRLRFRATLVMPAPIVRANTCAQGDTAVWEFDGDELFGPGFEMKALASAR